MGNATKHDEARAFFEHLAEEGSEKAKAMLARLEDMKVGVVISLAKAFGSAVKQEERRKEEEKRREEAEKRQKEEEKGRKEGKADSIVDDWANHARSRISGLLYAAQNGRAPRSAAEASLSAPSSRSRGSSHSLGRRKASDASSCNALLEDWSKSGLESFLKAHHSNALPQEIIGSFLERWKEESDFPTLAEASSLRQ